MKDSLFQDLLESIKSLPTNVLKEMKANMEQEQMRKEFEEWFLKEFEEYNFPMGYSSRPSMYDHGYVDMAWKGWKASREHIVVELPVDLNNWGDGYYSQAIDECKQSLESKGVKWK